MESRFQRKLDFCVAVYKSLLKRNTLIELLLWQVIRLLKNNEYFWDGFAEKGLLFFDYNYKIVDDEAGLVS